VLPRTVARRAKEGYRKKSRRITFIYLIGEGEEKGEGKKIRCTSRRKEEEDGEKE